MLNKLPPSSVYRTAFPQEWPWRRPVSRKTLMYYMGYDSAFEGHFNRLYLVTDTRQ